jgi:DNA-binding NarL/FixJ family response regulator
VRAIKRDPLLGTLPLLVYTSQGGPDDVQWALSGGCDGFIVKPGLAQDVLREVRRLLESRPSAAQRERGPDRRARSPDGTLGAGGARGDGSQDAMLA